jgi:acetyl esterase/lipase
MRSVHRGDAHSAFPLARGAARPCPSMTDDWPSLPPSRAVRVADVQLRGRAGPLRARAYWPVPGPAAASASASSPVPSGAPPLLVLFPRGTGAGGGPSDGVEGLGRGLCSLLGLVVLAVGYRPPLAGSLGPALEDATTATHWAADHSAELGADPGGLVVAGQGVGGDLAATVAREAADQVWPPSLRQVLVRPRLGAATLAAGSLEGLAPATVVAGPARSDEGGRYASLLRRWGVPVDELQAADTVEAAEDPLPALASSLRRALAPSPASSGPDRDDAE